MKERPILWSAPMVLAKLAGRKTQTRRICKKQPKIVDEKPRYLEGEWGFWGGECRDAGEVTLCPYGERGDRLWGRETWGFTAKVSTDGHERYMREHDRTYLIYRATSEEQQAAVWRPSIFMPRWASRLLDEVVSVRVERLQDISEADAIAEGIEDRGRLSLSGQRWCWPGGNDAFTTARAAYLAGWDTINGEGSAAKNPWVWVIEFRSL